MGVPQGCGIEGLERVGALPLGHKATASLTGDAANPHSRIFQPAIEQHHWTSKLVAENFHLVVIRRTWGHAHQHGALRWKLAAIAIRNAGDRIGLVRGIPLGQGRCTSIGKEQLATPFGLIQLPLQAQGDGSQTQPFKAQIQGPATFGLARQGRFQRREQLSLSGSEISRKAHGSSTVGNWRKTDSNRAGKAWKSWGCSQGPTLKRKPLRACLGP